MVNRPILQTITSHHLKGRFSIRTVVSRFGAFALLSIYTWSHGSNWKYQIYFFEDFQNSNLQNSAYPRLRRAYPRLRRQLSIGARGSMVDARGFGVGCLISEQFENKYVNFSLPWPPKVTRPITFWSQRWCRLIVTYMSNWWTNPLKDLRLILNWIVTTTIKRNVYIRIQGTTPNFSPNNLGILVSGMSQMQGFFIFFEPKSVNGNKIKNLKN